MLRVEMCMSYNCVHIAQIHDLYVRMHYSFPASCDVFFKASAVVSLRVVPTADVMVLVYATHYNLHYDTVQGNGRWWYH
jgi:hypothetical protein